MSQPVTAKVCATCQFWEGVMRGISRDGKRVEYKPGAKGTCTNFKSSRKQQSLSPDSSCGAWLRWSAIR